RGLDLLMPAARQERDHRRPVGDREATARHLARRRRAELIEERMADELHRHAGPTIERRLERKHREHERHEPPHRLHAPAAPRPYLGRAELHHPPPTPPPPTPPPPLAPRTA